MLRNIKRLFDHTHSSLICTTLKQTCFKLQTTQQSLTSFKLSSKKLFNSQLFYSEIYLKFAHHNASVRQPQVRFFSSLPNLDRMAEKKALSAKRKIDSDENPTTEKKQKLETSDIKSDNFIEKISTSRSNVCKSISEFKFNKKRVRVLSKAKDFPEDSQGVVYWMSRDQRVQGNYRW